MSSDMSDDQELNFKKRARRRLVGAVALVLVMIIVLPRILQDRAATSPTETIKITLPQGAPVQQSATSQQAVASASETPLPEPSAESVPPADITDNALGKTGADVKPEPPIVPAPAKVATVETKKAVEPDVNLPKTEAQKVVEPKVIENPPTQKNSESYAIQVGVYSDAENVKQLQEKLKQAGFTSRTEKVSTPKGEKIRLRVGGYASRKEAIDGLTNLQATGLSGIVVSDK